MDIIPPWEVLYNQNREYLDDSLKTQPAWLKGQSIVNTITKSQSEPSNEYVNQTASGTSARETSGDWIASGKQVSNSTELPVPDIGKNNWQSPGTKKDYQVNIPFQVSDNSQSANDALAVDLPLWIAALSRKRDSGEG